MARKRMIAQDFLTSADLAGSSMRLRLGFIAVLLFLDDYGRAQDDAEVIRAHAWPRDKVTPKQMADDLAEMAQRTVICQYQVNGKRYLHAPKWETWQKVQHKGVSRIPPCPSHDLHEGLVKDSREDHETFTPSVVEVSSDIDQVSSVEVKRASGDLTARSAAITAAYLALNPLAEKYPTQRIVAKAIGEAGYTDAQVSAALTRLAKGTRVLTPNTLYVEINGQSKGSSTTNTRVQQGLSLVEHFRAKEATIPTQRAIGGPE